MNDEDIERIRIDEEEQPGEDENLEMEEPIGEVEDIDIEESIPKDEDIEREDLDLDEEDIDPEEEINDINEQENFLKLMQELAKSQAILAKLDAQIALKEAKEQTKGVIDSTRDNIKRKAREFGANLGKIEEEYKKGKADRKEIIEEYKDELFEINEKYQDLMEFVLYTKDDFQTREAEILHKLKETKINIFKAERKFEKDRKRLKAKSVEYLKSDNYKKAFKAVKKLERLITENPVDELKIYHRRLIELRKEVRKEIKGCDEEYRELKEQRKEEIKRLTEIKNNYIAELPKQNVFQKIIGSLFSKANGTKKFMRTTFEPLKAKIEKIKDEDIPRIINDIDEKRKDFVKRVNDSKEKMVENVQIKVEEYSNALKDKKQKALETIKDMEEEIINKAKELGQNIEDTKDSIVEKAVNTKDNIVQGIKNTKDVVVDFVGDTKDSIVQGIKDTKDNISTKVNSTVEKGKRTFRKIIERGLQMKMNFINKLQNKLNDQRTKIEEKMDRLNTENRTETKESENPEEIHESENYRDINEVQIDD